jgi:hypothetical protein
LPVYDEVNDELVDYREENQKQKRMRLTYRRLCDKPPKQTPTRRIFVGVQLKSLKTLFYLCPVLGYSSILS